MVITCFAFAINDERVSSLKCLGSDLNGKKYKHENQTQQLKACNALC